MPNDCSEADTNNYIFSVRITLKNSAKNSLALISYNVKPQIM